MLIEFSKPVGNIVIYSYNEIQSRAPLMTQKRRCHLRQTTSLIFFGLLWAARSHPSKLCEERGLLLEIKTLYVLFWL